MTEEQRNNLRRLAKYLRMLPPDYDKFEMAVHLQFSLDNWNRPSVYAGPVPCGAVACAVGHGPAAGIKPSPDSLLRYTGSIIWSRYAENEFGVSRESWEWDYMFGGGWTYVDNTPQGAANRIDHFLKHGLPEGYEGPTEEFVL